MQGRPGSGLPQSLGGGTEVHVQAYWRIIKKRKYLIAAIIALATGASLAWSMSRQRLYEAEATVIVESSAPKVLPNSPEVVELGSNYLENKDYLNTQMRILKSLWLAREVVRKYPELFRDGRVVPERPGASGPDEDRAAEYVQDGVRVLLVRDSRILDIGFVHHDPQIAATLANCVVDVYIEQNRAVKVDATHDARRWVAKQLDDARKELETSEIALYGYKKQNNILSVNLEERQGIITKSLDDFSNARTEARRKRLDLEAHRVALAALVEADPSAAPSTYVAQSPAIGVLRGLYLEERRKLTALTDKYGAKWPEVVAQSNRTVSTLEDLRNEGRAMLRSLDAEIKSLQLAESKYSTEVDKLTAEALDLNQREIEYHRLKRAQVNAEQVYTALLKRLTESGLQERNLANNIRPLDTAQVPTDPVEPRIRQAAVFGFVFGAVLALALAFLVETMDRTVKSQEDVEVGLGLHFLGMVPSVVEAPPATAGAARELHIMQHPSSTAAECLRVVRTNILFCSAAKPLHNILVTSSNPLEGKTMTVVNLGVAMAQSGQRTLIIDTDMRRPRLHKILGVSNEHGVSRLIIGDDDLDSAIKSTDLPKLSVLPCGPLPPNPAELLQTERFTALVQTLGQRFDRLIFDSPPVLAVTDAAVLSRALNGVILVARAGRVTHDSLARARHQLHAVEAHIVGVVLNDVDLTNPHYTEYYGYTRRYYNSGEPVMTQRGTSDG
jgi:succinoglycan biosynthesis transport protein ExoP